MDLNAAYVPILALSNSKTLPTSPERRTPVSAIVTPAKNWRIIMSKDRGANTFYCDNCKLRFSLYATRKMRLGRVFCPGCGESAEVMRYSPLVHREGKREPRRSWTTQERRELNRLLKKGLTHKQIAANLNRSPEAIRKAVKRFGLSLQIFG